MTKTFDEIYETNAWGGEESRSGYGSDSARTKYLKKEIKTLLKELKIKTLLDCACGDFNWMKSIMESSPEVNYLGVDIVKKAIDENKVKYPFPNCEFKQLDIVNEPFPKVDLVLARDVLVHLSFKDIIKFIDRFLESKSSYLLTTSFTKDRINVEKDDGICEFCPVNLQEEPFSFPAPLRIIIEKFLEGEVKYKDKSLLLWSREQLLRMRKLTLNFITTGDKFPYAYYLGVMTAIKHYQGDIILWYVKEPESRYFELLKKVKGLELRQTPLIEEDFEKFSVFKTLSPHEKVVTMFDYLIWKIVSERGGIIAGLDSLTLSRWDDLLPESKEILVPRDYLAIPDSYAMHGVCVRKGSALAKKIFKDINSVMEGKEIKGKHKAFDENGKMLWGGAGIIPYLNNVYGKEEIEIVAPGILAGINSDCKENGFYLYQDKKVGEFISKETKTIPLYASSSNKFGGITEQFVATSNTLYAEVVKKLLSENVWNPFNEPVWGITMDNNLPLRKRDKVFRFHLLGLVHLPTSERYMACAFTQKNVKLAKMLLDLGHEVYLYGAEGSDAPCTKFIQTHTLKEIRDEWGEGDNRYEIGYNWEQKQFKHDINTKRAAVTLQYYQNAIALINANKKEDDFVLVTQGTYQKPITDAIKLFLTLEPGIGYRGSYANFRAFESSYIQNFTYGSENPRASINGRYYDRVIPNYFDEKDFPFQEKKEDYYLFMGRLIVRKGLDTAIKTVKAIGGRLLVAGQKSEETPKTLFEDPVVEYVGYADVKKRAELMGKAKAVFCPSTYLEPFCGVFAESNLCGTAVISTNFGAFKDYVHNGLNGYRCNTLQDFVDAAKASSKLNPHIVRKYAEQFTLNSVKLEYQRWFQDLYRVYESVKDPTKKAWHHLE